jgi:hypothetical protein
MPRKDSTPSAATSPPTAPSLVTTTGCTGAAFAESPLFATHAAARVIKAVLRILCAPSFLCLEATGMPPLVNAVKKALCPLPFERQLC